MAYRTTLEADDDIAEIFALGALEYGLPRARAYVEGLFDVLEWVGRNPLLARLRDEFERPVRFRQYGAHVVVYLDVDGDALIVRVLHGKQDLGRHFQA